MIFSWWCFLLTTLLHTDSTLQVDLFTYGNFENPTHLNITNYKYYLISREIFSLHFVNRYTQRKSKFWTIDLYMKLLNQLCPVWKTHLQKMPMLLKNYFCIKHIIFSFTLCIYVVMAICRNRRLWEYISIQTSMQCLSHILSLSF